MLIVMTTLRNGADYLPGTVAGLVDTFRDGVIVSDGPMRPDFKAPDGWTVCTLPKRGARATGWECLRLGLASKKGLLLLQDDLKVRNARAMAEAEVPDGCAAVSFFTPFRVMGLKDRTYARYVCMGAMGTAQALKFHPYTLQEIAPLDPFAEGAKQNITPLASHLFDDTFMAIARRSSRKAVAHMLPNAVEHVGEVSACGTKRAFPQQWVSDLLPEGPIRVEWHG